MQARGAGIRGNSADTPDSATLHPGYVLYESNVGAGLPANAVFLDRQVRGQARYYTRDLEPRLAAKPRNPGNQKRLFSPGDAHGLSRRHDRNLLKTF